MVNGLVHIVYSVVFRAYNPGVVTSVLLFAPASIFGIAALERTEQVEWYHHVLGIFIAIAIHVAIVGYVQMKKREAAGGMMS